MIYELSLTKQVGTKYEPRLGFCSSCPLLPECAPIAFWISLTGYGFTYTLSNPTNEIVQRMGRHDNIYTYCHIDI